MVVRLTSFFHLLVRFCFNFLRPCQALHVRNIIAYSYFNTCTCVQKKLMGFFFFFVPRSTAEEFKTEPVKVGCEENGVATYSEGLTICSDGGLKEGSKIQENVLLDGALPGCLENQRNDGNNGLDCNEYGGDKDMEKALEGQAKLIGRYEAMEKAQREWEEKFRENNSSTPVCFIGALLTIKLQLIQLFFFFN